MVVRCEVRGVRDKAGGGVVQASLQHATRYEHTVCLEGLGTRKNAGTGNRGVVEAHREAGGGERARDRLWGDRGRHACHSWWGGEGGGNARSHATCHATAHPMHAMRLALHPTLPCDMPCNMPCDSAPHARRAPALHPTLPCDMPCNMPCDSAPHARHALCPASHFAPRTHTRTCSRCLRSAGLTYAGFLSARRPTSRIARLRTTHDSSLSATNRLRRQSACE
eukprot:351606-Chlamydomonas_euryale.AAC.2